MMPRCTPPGVGSAATASGADAARAAWRRLEPQFTVKVFSLRFLDPGDNKPRVRGDRQYHRGSAGWRRPPLPGLADSLAWMMLAGMVRSISNLESLDIVQHELRFTWKEASATRVPNSPYPDKHLEVKCSGRGLPHLLCFWSAGCWLAATLPVACLLSQRLYRWGCADIRFQVATVYIF
jgi:hypothetical protein